MLVWCRLSCCLRYLACLLIARLFAYAAFARGRVGNRCFFHQVNVARDVAVQMCDTLEGKAYTGVVNVSYMAVANEVGAYPQSKASLPFVGFADSRESQGRNPSNGCPICLALGSHVSIDCLPGCLLLQNFP